jgi:hypothetical protein
MRAQFKDKNSKKKWLKHIYENKNNVFLELFYDFIIKISLNLIKLYNQNAKKFQKK